MLLSGRSRCVFLVYTTEDLKTITIEADHQFQQDMLAKLQCFYDDHLKPAILEKYVFKKSTKLYS